jgi:hypothetical protein
MMAQIKINKSSFFLNQVGECLEELIVEISGSPQTAIRLVFLAL